MKLPARLLIAGVAGIAILLAAEMSFRLIAGKRLLYRTDPDYEYFPQPNQSGTRLGVRYETNALGMRSPAMGEKPPEALRVLVLGDSVVFGHTNIGQSDLATSLLNGTRVGNRTVETLNVSAPSWGPGNVLAWLERHGTMNADMVVVVLSISDQRDDRTFAPPDPDAYPQQQPTFALLDWALRNLTPTSPPSATPFSNGDAMNSLPLLFDRLAAVPDACVIIHATRSEVAERRNDASRIEELASAAGLKMVHNRDHMDAAKSYIDDIHLSVEGQKHLANASFGQCLASASGI